jgi:hypothetical protein
MSSPHPPSTDHPMARPDLDATVPCQCLYHIEQRAKQARAAHQSAQVARKDPNHGNPRPPRR